MSTYFSAIRTEIARGTFIPKKSGLFLQIKFITETGLFYPFLQLAQVFQTDIPKKSGIPYPRADSNAPHIIYRASKVNKNITKIFN